MRNWSICVLLAILMLFASCADNAQPTSAYEELTFAASCIDLLGMPSDKAAKQLEERGTWEYLYDEAGNPNPRPNLAEPVTIAGRDYTLYFRFDPVCAWAFSYELRLDSTDDAEKNALAQEVFDLLYRELGEPEELVGAHSLKAGRATGLAGAEHEYYTEWWVLEENMKIEAEHEYSYFLTCRPLVEYAADSIVISVNYALYNHEKAADGITEIKRFAE